MQTREEILRVLKKRSGQHVSGQELSERLSLSRTAIWKHIQVLRKQGYKISASARQGYQFVASSELLLPTEIKPKLKTRIIGKDMLHFDKIPSTNDRLKKIAANKGEGTLVITEVQERGRGRLNRSWHSPRGGLWFSVLLRPSIISLHAPKLALVAAVAVVEVVRALGLKVGIKWPNDILVGKRKVAGILTEMAAQIDKVDYIIIGIGINANVNVKAFPRNLRKNTTSLKEEIGRKVDRVDLLTKTLEALEEKYLIFKRGRFSQLLEEWRQFDVLEGKRVKIQTREGMVKGTARGIDEEGNLVVGTTQGVKYISAGDVMLL